MGMDLSGLRDIHLPIHEVSIFPLAIGWWGLIILPFLLVLAFYVCRYVRKQSAKLYAIYELNNIFKLDISVHEKIVKISILLKRIAIKKFGNSEIAHLHSESWAKFIKKYSKSKDSAAIKIISTITYVRPNKISNDIEMKIKKISNSFIRNTL